MGLQDKLGIKLTKVGLFEVFYFFFGILSDGTEKHVFHNMVQMEQLLLEGST